MRAIFIDIDGVLNNPLTYFANGMKTPFIGNYTKDDFDQTTVKVLQRVIKLLDLKPVLASTWGAGISPQELYRLSATLGISFTGTLKDNFTKTRSVLITEYLAEHPEITNFAIVDDEVGSYIGTPLFGRLVHVDEYTGFTFANFQRLESIFGENLVALCRD